MAAFLSAGQKAAREHVSFSAEEQELLIQILIEGMSGEERKKAEAVRKLQDGAEKQARCITKRGAAETGCIILFRSIPLSVSFYKYPV